MNALQIRYRVALMVLGIRERFLPDLVHPCGDGRYPTVSWAAGSRGRTDPVRTRGGAS